MDKRIEIGDLDHAHELREDEMGGIKGGFEPVTMLKDGFEPVTMLKTGFEPVTMYKPPRR